MDIRELVYRKFVEDLDFVDVVDVDNSEGYEWEQFYGWYSPSRLQYFWLYGSGCSCNGIGDEVHGLPDLMVGSKGDLERSLREFMKDSGRAGPLGELDAVAEVKRFHPARLRKDREARA